VWFDSQRVNKVISKDLFGGAGPVKPVLLKMMTSAGFMG